MNANLIITISREYGSGGRQIGKQLSEKLSLPFYDKEIIELSAEKSGFDPNLIERHEENFPNSFLYSVAMGSYYVGTLFPDKIYQVEYNVIKSIAQKGPCVIVGRCANHILKKDFNCLNIFITAEFNARLNRTINEYGAPADQAKSIIETIDKQRARHFRHYTDNNWHDVSTYDLCLNSEVFGIDGCVDFIAKAYDMLSVR